MPAASVAMGAARVWVNVYDLMPQNSWTYWCGVGVFHTGVEVYGIEYAFGGAPAHWSRGVGCGRGRLLRRRAGGRGVERQQQQQVAAASSSSREWGVGSGGAGAAVGS